MATPTPPPHAVPAAQVTPLHARWPQILRYPAHPAALSTVVALAAAHLVILLPGVGWLLDLLVWAAFFKYGFEVLRWSANGRDAPPEISLTVSDAIGTYAVLLLILIEVMLIFFERWYGVYAALGVGIALMFAMPAMVMILALEEGPARALNPLAWLMLGARIGREYFVLVGFFCVALFVQSVFAAQIAAWVPGFVAIFATYSIVHYLMIANFHLIGSVIHAHGEELGYTGHLQLQDEVPHTNAARKTLDAARGRAASGDVKGAISLLREEIANQPEMSLLHDEYRHWLRQDGDQVALLAHAKTYIPILLAQDQERRALDVVHEAQVTQPTFALDDPAQITRLAHCAAAIGQTQSALGLLAGFHKRFRNHADIGRNYLLAAKLWAERMNKEMQARAMLNQIKVMLPNDAVIAEVDAYLAFLDQLAATPAKTPPPTKP